MATGGDVPGQCGESLGSEDLNELKCHPCHEDGAVREAVGICVDCQDYLCQKCFEIHTIPKPSRDHKLLDKEHMLREDIKFQRKDKCTQKCPDHDDEITKYYCTEHHQLACSVCLSLNHRTCKVQYIPDAAKDLDNDANFIVIEKQLNSVLELSVKVIGIQKQNIDSIESSSAEALENVETHRRNINNSLDKVQADLIEEAEALKSNGIKRLTQITGTYNEVKRDVEMTKAKIDELRKTNQKCDLYTQMMNVKDNVGVLNEELKQAVSDISCEVREIRFIPNQELPQMVEQQELFGIFSEIGNVNIVEVKHGFDINIKEQHGSSPSYFSGSTCLSDGKLVVVDWYSYCMYLVDVKQKKVKTSKKLSSGPWDVCTIDHNQVAVTFTNRGKIAFVSVSADMAVDREFNVNGQCRGIDCKGSKLAVSFDGPDKVQVMTLQGEVLHDIATDHTGQKIFHYPLHLTFGQDGATLYVSNVSGNTVVCVKLDGTVVATYEDGELKGPRTPLVDSNGNVYVCAHSSKTIHKISPESRKIRILLGQAGGLGMPVSLSYSETNKQFYVGIDRNRNMKVFNAKVESKLQKKL